MCAENPIFVSDLDETLIETTVVERGYTKITINLPLLDMFHRAMKLRKRGKIDAILLLTNNKNRTIKIDEHPIKFLDHVSNTVVEVFNEIYYPEKINSMTDIFDNIYSAEDSTKRTFELVKATPWREEPVIIYEPGPNMIGLRFREIKDIDTVQKMLAEINILESYERLQKRICFFDDEQIDHVIKKELEQKGTYITISPPYGKSADKTDYSPILSLLDSIEKRNIDL